MTKNQNKKTEAKKKIKKYKFVVTKEEQKVLIDQKEGEDNG